MEQGAALALFKFAAIAYNEDGNIMAFNYASSLLF
jgi:hypothetical protein